MVSKKSLVAVKGSGLISHLCSAMFVKSGYDVIHIMKGKPKKNNMFFAISPSSTKWLKELGFSEEFFSHLQKITDMQLIAESFGSTLTLKSEDYFAESLAYMVKQDHFTDAIEKMNVKKIDVKDDNNTSFEINDEFVNIKTGQKITKASLLVACDGNDCLVNEDSFDVTTKNYSESAFTCEFYSRVGNFSQATQIFYDNNIFALLPLENNLVQVVLFCNKELKSFLKSTTDDQLKKYLKDKMKNLFSIDSEVKNRSEFQLKDKSLKSILYKRLITIGDAAHIIHPMAGQGFNLGLRDIRNLEDLIRKKTNFDIGSRFFLRKYERDRKKDVTQLSNLTALISNFTFIDNKFNQKLKKSRLLSKSLSFAVNSKLLKQYLIKQATL